MTLLPWLADPTAWLGLGTLVVLEIVLGIDNLIFIAILAEKLPPEQRNRARIIGLSLALIMRLGLLAGISWIATLTAPLFTFLGSEISGRDIILIVGGLFLLFKGTMELHERLEGSHGRDEGKRAYASFWQVIVQIVVLDAVFSLDSVITAVGMVDELSVMVIAVIIAVAVMLLASVPLMAFVSRHPTVVILCLGFLLMIGFSLVAEGFGAHVPKGYLYAAIGFSVIVEAFNQIARRNREKLATMGDLRDRTAEAVLRLLGGGGRSASGDAGEPSPSNAGRSPDGAPVFAPEERTMIRGVLALAERPVRSIMTPSTEVVWLDLDGDQEELRRQIMASGHTAYPVCRGSLDGLVGVALTRELIRDLLSTGQINLSSVQQAPLVVPDSTSVLRVVDQLRSTTGQIAIVTDEFGAIEGVVTPTDILEAIVGELPDGREEALEPKEQSDGTLVVDAAIDVRRISEMLGIDLVDEGDRYATLAGYLLHRIGHLPRTGEVIDGDRSVRFEVLETDGRRIGRVRVYRSGGS
ncbi:TerC family protein [Enterovirga sp. CN4-39]|uniref:TerC family protein n=1 Tax=Enterovirga sp. CN4-39 TaxID=3400910 RepID=UPI003C0F3FEF